MDRKNVLIVNSRKPVVADLFTSDLIGRIAVITEPAFAHWFDARAAVAEVRTVPSIYDFAAVKDAAIGILARHRIDAILSPAEHGISTCGFLRSYFGLPGMGYETANTFANKHVMKQRLAAAELPVTAFQPAYRVEDVADRATELGWPVVVKPWFGMGTMNTFKLSSAGELTDLLASPQSAGLRELDCPLLVERHVEMSAEFHCDGVIHQGETRFVAVSAYVQPMLDALGGFVASYQLRPEDPDTVEIARLHDRVVAALRMRSGVTHLEVFKTSAGFVVGEITCRPGGMGIVDAIRLQRGADLWHNFLETAFRIEPTRLAEPARWADKIVVNGILPVRPGRITRLTTAEQIEQIPDVVRVDMSRKVGDVISTRTFSTAATGHVFLAVADEADIEPRMRQLADTYVLEVVPGDS